MHDTVSFIYSQIIKCISKDYRIQGIQTTEEAKNNYPEIPKSVVQEKYKAKYDLTEMVRNYSEIFH